MRKQTLEEAVRSVLNEGSSTVIKKNIHKRFVELILSVAKHTNYYGPELKHINLVQKNLNDNGVSQKELDDFEKALNKFDVTTWNDRYINLSRTRPIDEIEEFLILNVYSQFP